MSELIPCADCGGDCTPGDCGTHPLGCIFGGFSIGYWLVVDGCTRDHCDRHMDGEHINFPPEGHVRTMKGASETRSEQP